MKRTKSMETCLSLKPDCSIYYKSNDYQVKKKVLFFGIKSTLSLPSIYEPYTSA